VIAKALIATLLVAAMLSTVPLPYSDEGHTTIAPGGHWSYSMELVTRAHVTSIVRSSVPLDFVFVREGDPGDGSVRPISVANGTTVYRPTDVLDAGKYRLVATNPGPGEARVTFQVHQDFIVVANMTAKNVMALSLALSMGIVALFLYGRPRRP
jgi:hypothetical protein